MALPPEGVNVTEDMLRLVVPQFQDTPTSIRRFVPAPVVTLKLMLLLLGFAVPLDTVPSRVTEPGTGSEAGVIV